MEVQGRRRRGRHKRIWLHSVRDDIREESVRGGRVQLPGYVQAYHHTSTQQKSGTKIKWKGRSIQCMFEAFLGKIHTSCCTYLSPECGESALLPAAHIRPKNNKSHNVTDRSTNVLTNGHVQNI